MTSWIRAAPPALKRKDEVAGAAPSARSFFYQTTEEDPVLQFLELLYFYMYSRAQGGVLHIYDMNNAISSRFGLFRSFFKECEGLVYTDMRPPNSTALNGKFANVMAFLNTQKLEQIRAAADVLFTLRDEAMTEVQRLMNNLPLLKGVGGGTSMAPTKDKPLVYATGIYLQRPQRGQPSLSNTVSLLRSAEARRKRAFPQGNGDFSIFVVADDQTTLQDFQRLADKSWTLYSYTPKQIPAGSSSALQRMRRENLFQFITELGVLQGCPALLAPLESSVGRFLFLTTGVPEGFQAADSASFTPF